MEGLSRGTYGFFVPVTIGFAMDEFLNGVFKMFLRGKNCELGYVGNGGQSTQNHLAQTSSALKPDSSSTDID